MASSTMEESKLPGGYLVTPRVPQGLAAAVEGLTREVIRHSPEDIYVFAAHHFEKLLLLREQCGADETPTSRDGNLRTLREMSLALRARELDRGKARTTRNASEQVGWSLSETAKVLKRHRSIFGEAGRRISTDEVFQMANQKENRSRASKLPAERDGNRTRVQRKEDGRPKQKPSKQIAEELWKASTSGTERSWTNEDSLEVTSETRSGPRIITRIPSCSTGLLAKDIKSELRKNRISSRERRNVRAKPEDRTVVDGPEAKSATKVSGRHAVPRKSTERQKRTETEAEKRNRRSVESSRSSKELRSSQRSPDSRALSMDRVKDYVVQRFATTKSLEELQSLNYVEKVREIIDETGPIIKGKVEELKSGMIGRSKRSSWFAETGNDRSRNSNGSNRGSVQSSGRKTATDSAEAQGPTADALRNKLTETQQLLENVSSKITRPRRSRSARSSRRSTTCEEVVGRRDAEEETAASKATSDRENGLERRLSKTRNLMEDISSTLSRPMRRSTSAKSLRKLEENDDNDFRAKDALKTRLDETRNLLEGISAGFAMPGHRVRSSKGRRSGTSSSLVAEEMSSPDSRNTSKVSLPAVRSASTKSSSGSVSRSDSDILVLPAISPEAPKSKKVREDLVLPVLSPPGTGSSHEDPKVGNEIDVFAEEDIPEIPVEDYVSEAIVEDVFRDSLNVTPDFDSIPQRPDSLEPPETAEDIEEKNADNLRERLEEIQKVEKNIEEVFTSKTSGNPVSEGLGDSGMKEKLRELEEAEKRIERIFDSEVVEGDKNSTASETKAESSAKTSAGSGESERHVKEEIATETIATNGSEVNGHKEDENTKDGEQGKVNLLAASPEPLNYTYVLTEGSPYDIPDTVTTVIIPEPTVDSPASDRLDIVLEDGLGAKLSLVSEGTTGKGSEVVEEIGRKGIADTVEDIENVDDTSSKEFSQPDIKSPTDRNDKGKKSPSTSPKDGHQSTDDDSSPKNASDPFGELVEPESAEQTSEDLDFIRAIENHQEIHVSHQDLGRINEEMSEELEEGLEERDDVNKPTEQVEVVEEAKGEDIEKVIVSPDGSIIQSVEEGEVKKKEVHEATKTPETIEAMEKTKEEDTDVAASSSDDLIVKEKEDDEVNKVEVDEAMETPKGTKVIEETKEENSKETADSPNGSMTNKEKEGDEAKRMEVDEETKSVETIEAAIEEPRDSPDGPTIQIEKEEDGIQKAEVDKSKSRTESDLSPEASRPDLDSESSNEAKESSGPDEPLESTKCANSADEEESSDTRSPESSNEVKETTLTDGLSLSLDPTRPFVPELNLDSLQDITVSSFKMTEDDCDNQARDESANTNSITDTLTSDENHRIIENVEYPEEAVVEYLASSSERSKLENVASGREEVVEETIVKSQVEIKEDICEKKSAYVTGPCSEEEGLPNGEANHPEVETRLEEKAEEDSKESTAKRSTGDEMEEIRKTIDEENKGDKEEKRKAENVEHKEALEEGKKIMEPGNPVEEKIIGVEGADEGSTEDKSDAKSVSLEVQKMESPSEDETTKVVTTGKVDSEEASEEERKNMVSRSPVGEEKAAATEGEDTASTEEKSDPKSTSFDGKTMEEIKEDKTESLEVQEVEDSEGGNDEVEEKSMKEPASGDLSGEVRSVEEESDEIPEESFVEEETPLAVSRSASQCTTRRVSSGNLARLREDPTFGWTEETEREIGDEEDAGSTKMKFSMISAETIREQGSDEIDQSQDSASSKNASGDSNGNATKDSREYHIYVPEVGASEDNSTTESSTVDSAVTKIQARVRGFLTRRRIHRGQHNRSSTLSSIPSIQDSVAVDTQHIDDHHQPETQGRTNGETDENVSSSLTLDDPGLENAATRIQSNYRGYKARMRLKREDAVQRTTLSLEKSFAESGLQHTGEFHDCIPLPIYDIPLGSKSQSRKQFEPFPEQPPFSPSGTKVADDDPEKFGKIFFGQSVKDPLVQFGMSPNLGQLVDLVVLAKNEAALQSSYLNFITSVEDAETIQLEPGVKASASEFSDGHFSNESLKEPLALSATPVGVIIEEVTSSDFEALRDDHRSSGSTVPAKESLGTARAPCASFETVSESTEDPKVEVLEGQIAPETHEDGLVLPTESSAGDFGLSGSFPLSRGIDLLGPESSVDSMECPVVGGEAKKASSSSGGEAEASGILGEVAGDSKEEKVTWERRDSPSGSEVLVESAKVEEPLISNVDDVSSTLSFSLKVEDFLGLGAEDSTESRAKKPILEVTLTPGDVMKSKSLSQESQLAGERIESPITMVQMAPVSSESLQLEERGESGGEDEESGAGKKSDSSGSAKSGHK